MKKFTMNIALVSIFSLLTFVSFSQTSIFEIRVVENDLGYLDVQMRETTGGGALPSNTDGDKIGDLTYAIRWSDAIGADVHFLCSSNAYNITDPSGAVKTDQTGWHYRYYNASPAPFDVPTDWVEDEWETIVTYTVEGNSNTGTFEIAPQNFGTSTLNITVAELAVPPYHQYLPIVNGGAVNYAFPTLVYNRVWIGGAPPTSFTDEHSWKESANWEDQCGALTTEPHTSSNVLIPSGRTYYPENMHSAFVAGIGNSNNILVQSGGLIDFGIPTNQNEHLWIQGNLSVYGNVNARPNSRVTVSGNTYLDGAECLVVEAAYDATAGETQVGSLITHGPVTYGASGSANVQIHLEHNNPAVGGLYYHQVGPTVDDPAQTYSGVRLEAFNLNDVNDFAYTYDESVAPGGQPWVNIFDYDEEIHTTSGMMITANNNTSYTIDMVGHIISADFTSDPLTFSGSHLELISNPYTSAISFDDFYANTGNDGVINNKNWVWNPATSNYLARAAGSGGVEFIQVGQAFFVETNAAGSVVFDSQDRYHSTDPFRDVMTNVLNLNINSTATTFADELVIRFEEGASTGYDEAIEAVKWNSMYEDASMIRSIAEDGTELSVNVMPQLDLQGEMVSVPVHFQTGIDGEYTFTASDLESFEYGTEIWIEDKLDGNQWHHFSPGHDTYTFTASANDAHDRFIIHFFGPTGVDQFEAKNVLIYADNEYAIIRNMTKNEIVKEISIYSLAGTKLLHKQVPEQNMYRFFVSNHDNYYIVRVVTDKNIYTEKVFVH